MNPILDPGQLGLRDIHLPGDISWWPLALGWWVLALALIGSGIFFALRYFRYRRHRAACRDLRKLSAEIKAGGDPRLCAIRASTTLRRFAMTMAKDSAEVAGLTGRRWLSYLESRTGGSAFSDGAGQLLLTAPYRAVDDSAADDSLELCSVCEDWVRAQPLRG
jgi:hypothetical protein